MSMTGAWIYTEGTRSGRWANISLLGIEDAGGIPSAEWNNLTTGSGLLLFADGTWNHSGQFHLYFKGAGSEQSSQVDDLLAPADPHYPASPTAWRGVWHRCVDYVNHLIGGEVVVLEEFAQEWRVSMEAREAEAAAARREIQSPDPDEVVRRAAETAKARLREIRRRRVDERLGRAEGEPHGADATAPGQPQPSDEVVS